MNDRLDCHAVDELDGALALGAIEWDEARAVELHLAACSEPHDRLRAMLATSDALGLAIPSAEPSPALRDRLMATVARTAQEHAPRDDRDAVATRRGGLDWLSPRLARPLALAAVVALLAVGAWNLGLQSQLGERDRALRAVADALSAGEAAFQVEGSAGSGYVVDTPGIGASLVIAEMAALPADRLYELWLLDAAGTPVAVGTFTPSALAIAVVPIERDLTGMTTFAVTIEAERVEAPTGAPVMAGTIET